MFYEILDAVVKNITTTEIVLSAISGLSIGLNIILIKERNQRKPDK